MTIITVVLNNHKLLPDAIESVLNQTYDNIEYIIVDGGSIDGSLDVIQSYGNKINQVISEQDKGIYDAMNKGLSIANGSIIGFLNSDDFYADTNAVSDIVNTFIKVQTDAVYADLDYVALHDKHKVIRKWRSGNYTKQKFYYGWMPPHPTFFVKAAIYKQFGGFNTKLKSAADYELMLRLALVHNIKLGYLSKVLVKMRLGGQSNRNIRSRVLANLEDKKAWQINNLTPFWYTFLLKPIRKIAQYF